MGKTTLGVPTKILSHGHDLGPEVFDLPEGGDTVVISGGQLTREMIEEAYRRCVKSFGTVYTELHHPRCPKFVTQGEKACRCGACPMEALLEDDLGGRLP